jgi:3-deoxy-7-phosphoheptulonate synthase
VTDACVDWSTTEEMIRNTRDILREILPKRSAA